MNKVIHPFNIVEDGKIHPVFCKIEYRNGTLSITGVEHPYRNGNAWGSCGQIIMGYKEFDPRGYNTLEDVYPASGWTRDAIHYFFTIWDRWHLNDMNSACRHQKSLGWTYESHRGMYVPAKNEKRQAEYDEIVTILETSEYNAVYQNGKYGDKFTLKNGKLYIYNEFRGHECPVCGYSIGSQWLTEEIPQEVISYLESLPESELTPAWV